MSKSPTTNKIYNGKNTGLALAPDFKRHKNTTFGATFDNSTEWYDQHDPNYAKDNVKKV